MSTELTCDFAVFGSQTVHVPRCDYTTPIRWLAFADNLAGVSFRGVVGLLRCGVPPLNFERFVSPCFADEARVVQLKGGKRLDDLVAGLPPGFIFIHARLPPVQGALTVTGREAITRRVRSSLRKFTVNGAVLPEAAQLYYILPPDLARLEEHVVNRTFFMLYGQRGAGKTTAALHLLDHVERTHGWPALVVDFNSVNVRSTPEAFWRSMSTYLGAAALELSTPIRLASFNSVDTFKAAFGRAALGDQRLIIMLDEFDTLDHATPGIKEEVLGAVRAIKQDKSRASAIQCIFAVGPFSILFLEGSTGSPFNVREAVHVHFFTERQVSDLLAQFSGSTGVELEDGVAADIFEFTGGHAGLVCACGRALESIPALRTDNRISLAAWRNFRVRRMVEEATRWPTIGKIANSVAAMPSLPRQLLERALMAWDAPLTLLTEPDEVRRAARYLTAEGWLVAHEPVGSETYSISSSLLRSLALRRLSSERVPHLTAELPLQRPSQQLAMQLVIATALPHFSSDIMRAVPAVATKLSTAPLALARQPAGMRVPNEAAYHFQLFSVLRQWLGYWNHADLYPEADVPATGAKKRRADLLLIGRGDAGAPQHIIELAASTDDVDVREHYARPLKYMGVHHTRRGACVTFTALPSVSEVTSMDPSLLVWPSPSQLDDGLVAIHVVHDLAWTTASVVWRDAGNPRASPMRVCLDQPATGHDGQH